MKLDKYLQNLIEEFVPQQGDHLYCDVCGREVSVTRDGKGPLICCGQPMEKKDIVIEAGFKKKPKGWTNTSIKKFANTLMKNEAVQNAAKKEGFFDRCVERMTGKVQNPQGFCAAIKDEAHSSTGWRGKDKSPQQVKKDVRKEKFKLKK